MKIKFYVYIILNFHYLVKYRQIIIMVLLFLIKILKRINKFISIFNMIKYFCLNKLKLNSDIIIYLSDKIEVEVSFNMDNLLNTLY